MKILKEYLQENSKISLKKYILEADDKDDDTSLDDLDNNDTSDDLGDDGDNPDDSGEDNADDISGDEGVDEPDDKNNSGIKRADIKFTIWKAPDEKVTELDNNNAYQKIEYKLENKEQGLSIDFLLGFKDSSWQLWIGKIGSCSYDDDPYFSFNTDNFKKAIVMSIDKIEEFVLKVKDDPENYVQFYIHK